MKRLFGGVVTAMILAIIITFGGMPLRAAQAAGNIGLVFSPLMAPGTWNALGNGTDIYASGKFTTAGGNANADYIARLEVDANAPTVDSFTVMSPSASLDIPITSFIVSDDVAVTGYIITESATPPSAGAAGWIASAPTTYTVASDGSYTLYPWAKDAADNVSAAYGSPASVVVDTSTVTNNNDSGVGSLRYAIAGAAPGDTITFDPALSGETIHLASTLDISKSLTIDGSALASKITISGDSDNDGTGDLRVFHIDNVFGISVTLDSLIVTRGLASGSGMNSEGGAILNERALTIRNSIVSNNSSTGPGGAISAYYALTIIDSTFSGNSSTDSGTGGGAIYNVYTLTIIGSTFSGNSAAAGGGAGGAIINTAAATITNSTFTGNSAAIGGAILTTNDLTITNSTIAANSATSTGGLDIEGHITNLSNTIIANNSSSIIGSFSNNDCVDNASPLHLGGIGTNINNLIEDGTCSASLSGDPKLGPMADNGGPTQTMALLAGSPAFDAGDDGTCPAADQRGLTRPQGAYCDIGAYEAIYANIDANINGTPMAGSPFKLRSGQSTRVSFAGMNSGPVNITSTYHSLPILGAERVIYKAAGGIPTSFSEMMGLPNSQLDNTYWLPWYNNVDLDTQLRFANLSGSSASVHVWIGGTEMTGSPFTLAAGESTRQSFVGINNGPVEIVSTVNMVAAERVIYKVKGTPASFSETMALSNNQLDNIYWLPWYNNVDLDTQLRIGNASGAPATIHVSIGGTEVTPASGISLLVGASTRVSFAGVNDGPVKIESDQNIVAAERVIYKVKGTQTSFSEMMALPDSQLNTTYWLPWYNNVDLDTQLRFGNVSSSPATVHIFIGGVELTGSPFSLAVGAGTRMSFAGINSGPVQIVSDVNIVAAERVIYKFSGMPVSFSEMMGLPHSGLDTTYWLPWYNNMDLETQLRFGMP